MFNFMRDGAKSINNVISKIEDQYIDPDLSEIEEAIETLKADFKYDAAIESIEQTLGNLTHARKKIRESRDGLFNLAGDTIGRVEDVLNKIEKFTTYEGDKLKRVFKQTIRCMIDLLEHSQSKLDYASDRYDEAQSSLTDLRSRIENYKDDVDTFMQNKDGELEEWVKKYREKNYPWIAACAFGGPFLVIICPVVSAVVLSNGEATIEKAQAQLEIQKQNAINAKEIVGDVINQINKSDQYIVAEQNLIANWEDKIKRVKPEMLSVEDVMEAIKLEMTEDLKMALNRLVEACIKYREHEDLREQQRQRRNKRKSFPY